MVDLVGAIGGAVGDVVGSLSGALGAEEGSVTKDTMDLTSPEQIAALNAALTTAGTNKPQVTDPYTKESVLDPNKLDYKDPGSPGMTDVMSGFTPVDYKGMSIGGMDRFTVDRALAGVHAMGDKAAGMESDISASGFEARKNKQIQDAYKTLGETKLAGRRGLGGGGAKYASAVEGMDAKAYEQFGSSVGTAIATAQEDAFKQRTELNLKAFEQAADAKKFAATTEQKGLIAKSEIELQAFNKAADVGLANFKNLMEGTATLDANNIKNAKNEVDAALAAGKLTADEAASLNAMLLKKDEQFNNATLSNLQLLISGGTATTKENVVTQDPGSEGMLPGLIEGGSSIIAAKMMAVSCMPGTTEIDTPDGPVAIVDLHSGDLVIGYDGKPTPILQKHEYANPEWRKVYTIEFSNGAVVEVCDNHRILGKRAKEYDPPVAGMHTSWRTGVTRTYDILTDGLGYQIQGVPVNSMIPEMVTEAIKLERAA